MAWVDPRFRTKKDKKLKPIKLNQFGQAACDIRDIVPGRQSAGSSIASGASLSRPSTSGVSGVSRPSTARPTVARPGTATPCRAPPRPPARPPPLAQTSTKVKQVGVSWRTHQESSLRPPSSFKQIRVPGSSGASGQSAYPPSTSQAPCPPAPCPPPTSAPRTAARAPSPTRAGPSTPRSLRPPSVYSGASTSRASSEQSKCQKIVLLPGDINPDETTVITVEPPPKKKETRSVRFVSTKSAKPRPAWVGPCPEPEPEPTPQTPRGEALQISPPRTGTIRRPPPRFARFGSTSQAPCPAPGPPPGPCPEPCPPAPCPPPPCPERYSPCPDPCQAEPYTDPCPPTPCADPCPSDLEVERPPCEQPSEPPNPDDLWFEEMMGGNVQASASQQSVLTAEYSATLIDISPTHGQPRGFEWTIEEYPEDLIQWEDNRDPFSPPPPVTSPVSPRCIDFAGKQDPFSPPTYAEYYSKRYILPQDHTKGPHPIYARPSKPSPPREIHISPPNLESIRPRSPQRICPPPPPQAEPCPGPSRRRSPLLIDRELFAFPVPHNRRVSTVTREESVEELGLLPDDLMQMEYDFDEPLTGARQLLKMYRDPLQESFDRKEYEKEAAFRHDVRSQEERLRRQVDRVEEFFRKPAVRPRCPIVEAGAAAARRVLDKYNLLCEAEKAAGQQEALLDEIAIEDAIDFDAIENEECD